MLFDFHDVDEYGYFQSQTVGRLLHCMDTKMRKIDNLHNRIHRVSSKLKWKEVLANPAHCSIAVTIFLFKISENTLKLGTIGSQGCEKNHETAATFILSIIRNTLILQESM